MWVVTVQIASKKSRNFSFLLINLFKFIPDLQKDDGKILSNFI